MGWGVNRVYSPGLESAWSGEAARLPGGSVLSQSRRCGGDLRLGASLNLQDVPGGLSEGLLTRV